MARLPHDRRWRNRYDRRGGLGSKTRNHWTRSFKTVHPHPTMSEAMMEAVAAAYDEVIHI